MHGAVLRVLVGHILRTFGLRTELYSILESVFKFVIEHEDEWAPLDDVTRAESVTCRGVVF